MRVHTDLTKLPVFKQPVLTIGSFDGVHEGHRTILDRVRNLCAANDCESVVITFHPHPRLVLQKDQSLRLLNTLAEKTQLLADCGIDHLVVVPFTEAFSQMSPESYVFDFLVGLFKPSILVIGYDHRFGHDRSGNISMLHAVAEKAGFQIEEIPMQMVNALSVSSTKIRKAVLSGDMELCNSMLATPFPISGKVVHGKQLGRTIGFPTANIEIEEKEKLLPPVGIYAVRVHVRAQVYGGMLYIGPRPTLDDGDAITIEVNIFDFDADIYGQTIRLEVLARTRDDQKFDGLSALTAQLAIDKQESLAILARLDNKMTSKFALTAAVVILNYNGQKHLETYLPSVLENLPLGVQAVVVDNASTDNSVAWLKQHYPAIACIQLTENYGFAGGYNEGLKQVKADIFFLLNSDVRIKEDWTTPIIRIFEQHSKIGIAQPKILSDLKPEFFEYAGAAGGMLDGLGYPYSRGRIFDTLEKDNGQYDSTSPLPIFWASGAAMGIRSTLFEQLGGFDASFFAHMEEIDLCWRAQRAGQQVVCVSEAKVWHLGGGTIAYQSPRKTYLNFRNNLQMLIKNEPIGRLLWLFPFRLGLDGLAALQFATKGQFVQIWQIVKAHWHVFFSFFRIAAQGERDKKAIQQIVGSKEHTVQRKPFSVVWQYFAKGRKTYNALDF